MAAFATLFLCSFCFALDLGTDTGYTSTGSLWLTSILSAGSWHVFCACLLGVVLHAEDLLHSQVWAVRTVMKKMTRSKARVRTKSACLCA